MGLNVTTTGRIEVSIMDQINHPEHYTAGNIECIEAIKASMTLPEFESYLKGNCMKYLWRYKHKGGVDSLCKCEWYLIRLINELQGRKK
jgi:hypothetical protein